MTVVRTAQPLYRRPRELGRRIIAFLVGFTLKAYGVAAVVSVGVSDAETIGGKSYDAVRAVPNLMDRYREAKYVVDHREQVQAALDYAHQNAPDAEQLDLAAQKSSQTLDRLTTTYREFDQARETFTGVRPNNFLDRIPRAKEHFDRAWAAKPDLKSVEDVAANAQEVETFLKQLDLQSPDVRRVYANLLSVVDNFASDEIVATLAVMAAAFTIAYTLGMAAGYWGRRGRPGFIAATLQRWGTRHFKDWYVANLEFAMSWPLYSVARERIQREILADPEGTLDPEVLQELKRYFDRWPAGEPSASPGSVTAPRPTR